MAKVVATSALRYYGRRALLVREIRRRDDGDPPDRRAEQGAKAERINVEKHKDWMKGPELLTVYE
jgi:hypothetical protein